MNDAEKPVKPTQPPKDRRFRKKPVVVSAFPGDELLTGAIEFFPEWVLAARREEKLRLDPMFGYVIETLEGEMVVGNGDWIIRGVRGELYPCKPGIFAATYEECTDVE